MTATAAAVVCSSSAPTMALARGQKEAPDISRQQPTMINKCATSNGLVATGRAHKRAHSFAPPTEPIARGSRWPFELALAR